MSLALSAAASAAWTAALEPEPEPAVEQRNYTRACKCVVIGDAGVGKTLLTKALMASSAATETFTSDYKATVGVEFSAKLIELPASSERVKLQIWDTAGQERFRSVAESYYRGANIGIVVYSVTDLASFQSAEQWINALRGRVPDARIWLVGNKNDVEAHERVVSTDTGAARANLSDVSSFLETSAKTRQGVADLMTQIGTLLAADATHTYAQPVARANERTAFSLLEGDALIERRAAQPPARGCRC